MPDTYNVSVYLSDIHHAKALASFLTSALNYAEHFGSLALGIAGANPELNKFIGYNVQSSSVDLSIVIPFDDKKPLPTKPSHDVLQASLPMNPAYYKDYFLSLVSIWSNASKHDPAAPRCIEVMKTIYNDLTGEEL